jgi:Fe-S cluster assembly protein SufD
VSAALSTATEQEKQSYLADLSALGDARRSGPRWLRELRAGAEARFAERPFPTTHDEDWKYTSVAPILRVPFRTRRTTERLTPSDIESLGPFHGEVPRLVFDGGMFAPELSSGLVDGTGFTVRSLGDAFDSAVVERHLGRHIGSEPNAFVLLNTALLLDGAVVYVPRGRIVEQPVHIVFVAASEDGLSASHPRVLIVADEGAQATIVESYVSEMGERSFTNAATEVVVGDGAVVRHCRIQNESDAAFHIATTSVHLGRDGYFSSFVLSAGGALARSDLNVTLGDTGGTCALDGLYLAGATQHVDNHTAIDHSAPYCGSRQLYKGVLGGRARAVFNGKVIVRPGAQKTDAQQTNRNLLLSNEATVDTKPQLEIFADDVKCTHGAAIGQLDEEAMFYLKSRGMDGAQARVILTQGFAVEVLGRLMSEAVRPPLEQLVLARLRKGL